MTYTEVRTNFIHGDVPNELFGARQSVKLVPNRYGCCTNIDCIKSRERTSHVAQGKIKHATKIFWRIKSIYGRQEASSEMAVKMWLVVKMSLWLVPQLHIFSLAIFQWGFLLHSPHELWRLGIHFYFSSSLKQSDFAWQNHTLWKKVAFMSYFSSFS